MYDDKIRPVVDPYGEGRYRVYDGRKEITLGDLSKAARKE